MTAEPRLPTEHDFNPWNDPTDAHAAWHDFGGLTLDEAYAKFCDNSLYYQEDFMFMGGKAFAYYFPVIEKYLRHVPDVSPCGADDREAWILAKCIENQFRGDNAPHVQHLKERVLDLANFVREHLHRFGEDGDERQKIANAWSELVAHVKRIAPS
jgi:hypothetical protein